jgi:DNA invertase Pin-like site-specific DNA recombinase
MTRTTRPTPTIPTATAVIYSRVSSKDQEREGFSVPAQQKLLREYAREHRLTIVREFIDVETAKQAGRGGFGEMLAFLKSDPSCRTILVEKTDRLYRNIKDWITLDELDVAVHFVKEGAIVSKESRSSDKFMHGIKVLMAKNYVDNLSEEVRKGLREKAEQGHWPGVAHVGYVNNRVSRRIDVDPVRGPLVARVFEMYATGEFSLKSLAKRAYDTGLRHSRGDRRMATSELHRMLKNPIYVGDFRWVGKLRKGSHDPLVSRDTFERVQEVLGGTPRPRHKRKHAFMGLLTCGRCGCTMTAEMKKGRYVYYRCTGFKGLCGNAYIRQEVLAQLLATTVDAIQIPTDAASNLEEALRTCQSLAEVERRETKERLEKQRRAILSKLDRGYDDYLEGRISEDFWTRKSEQWEEERRGLEAQILRLTGPSSQMALTGQRILELAKQAGFQYRTQDSAQQRRMLETVLSNCTFDRGTLCPAYAKPFDLFARANETGNWRRGWDSNPTGCCGFCKLQNPHCPTCRECHRCRGTLHAVARPGEVSIAGHLRKERGGPRPGACIRICRFACQP